MTHTEFTHWLCSLIHDAFEQGLSAAEIAEVLESIAVTEDA
jgi:hypothetical protein